jgi:hypothetical protein
LLGLSPLPPKKRLNIKTKTVPTTLKKKKKSKKVKKKKNNKVFRICFFDPWRATVRM